MIREEIMQALLILVSQSSNFATFGRRLVHWGKVAAQPAAFVVEVDNEYGQHGGTFPPVRTLGAEVWIYARTDPQAPPGATLNPLLDAVELALQPPFPGAAQTLGGLVTHCWIGADDGQKAKILIDEGHLDDQAKAIIPVRMLVPDSGQKPMEDEIAAAASAEPAGEPVAAPAAEAVTAGDNPQAAPAAGETPHPTSMLIERWWEDHFPGSAVARDTAAWNVAHAAKEALKRLLRGSN